jgi:hypothetical protein
MVNLDTRWFIHLRTTESRKDTWETFRIVDNSTHGVGQSGVLWFTVHYDANLNQMVHYSPGYWLLYYVDHNAEVE